MNIIKVIQVKEVFNPYLQEKISPSLGYKIYNLFKFAEQQEVFFNQKLREIIEEYAQRNDKGEVEFNKDGGVKLIEDRKDEAIQKARDLESIEIEMPNIKFTLDELSEIKLSVTDIALLDSFIEDNIHDI